MISSSRSAERNGASSSSLNSSPVGWAFRTAVRLGAKLVARLLRRWDEVTAGRPSAYVAISQAVAMRIRERYGRDPIAVVYPPVRTNAFSLSLEDDGYALVVARLLAYKRIDLAIRACAKARIPLLVVGDGPERERLRGMAGATTRFLGAVDESELRRLYS